MTCWLCGFETTELATHAKAPVCKNGPCQLCTQVANVDEEIDQVVATLRRLLAKRCDLRSEQNRVHGDLIHRLPTELKNYIFELVSPARTEWGEQQLLPSWGRGRGGILYTSVCRNWRDLAWSNPFLWSAMRVRFGDTPNSINFMRDWILRSQTLPLTLDVLTADGCSKQSKGITDAINECSNRCHTLSLMVSSDLVPAFDHSNFQCGLLRNLRVHAGLKYDPNGPPLSNLTMSPEKIEIHGIPFQSLQISWSNLTSAAVTHFDLQDLMRLFQHAPQMTWCQITGARIGEEFPLARPIVHQKLKTLGFFAGRATQEFFASVTLPCLQEVCTSDIRLLNYLPALVHRSSCPLTRITFDILRGSEYEFEVFRHLQPLRGVTDLVVEEPNQTATIGRLLAEDYFPDLHQLTLRLDPFLWMWDPYIFPLLLDRDSRPRLGGASRPRKVLVNFTDSDRHRVFQIMNSAVGQQVKEFIDLREGSFEVLIPE